MFGNPPQLTAPSCESVHCRRYHPVDCIEINRTIIVADPISHSFPHMFNPELEGEAAVGIGQPARVATSRWKRTSLRALASDSIFPWANEGFGGFDRAERFIELVLESSRSVEDD
jgi:hypothetical protein